MMRLKQHLKQYKHTRKANIKTSINFILTSRYKDVFLLFICTDTITIILLYKQLYLT